MQRLVFSSPGAAAGPAEAKRLARWWDEFRATVGGTELVANPDMPFATKVEYLPLGAVRLGRWMGSIDRIERRREHAARDGDDRFTLSVNCSGCQSWAQIESRSAAIAPGGAFLGDYARAGFHACRGWYSILAVHMPRRMVLQALPGAEDLFGAALPADNEALRLLLCYAGGLIEGEAYSHPALLAQAGAHLVDLVTLAFGTDRDHAEIARQRGLRAARLDAALRLIRADYADPEIAPGTVAARIGISTRYLQSLLEESGTGFTERIQALRLQKVSALLSGETGRHWKISDAAYAAGFNDLSHFNRLFRRRYGLSPTAARGRRD